MLEPVQGESGVHVLPDELLRAARAACDEHGAPLIFDEIQCGMGRTGTLWAYEQLRRRARRDDARQGAGRRAADRRARHRARLADVLEPGDHGSTFAGGPLVAAAAHAVLDVIDDPELLARVRERGALLREGCASCRASRRARRRAHARHRNRRDAPELVRRALLEQRLVLNATGPRTLRFLPPLVVGEAEIDDALGALRVLLSG